MKYLLFACLLVSAVPPSFAQTASLATYEFLTVMEAESQVSAVAKIVFAPAFQRKSEIALEALPGNLSSKYWPTYQCNLQGANQRRKAVTAAEWELCMFSLV